MAWEDVSEGAARQPGRVRGLDGEILETHYTCCLGPVSKHLEPDEQIAVIHSL